MPLPKLPASFLVCVLAAAGFVLLFPADVRARRQDEAAVRLLNQAARRGATVATLYADFLQEKHMTVLQTPLFSRGRFCLRRSGDGDTADVLWFYTEPVPSGFLYRDGRAAFWDVRQGAARPIQAHEAAALRAVVHHMLDWIDIDPGRLHAAYRMERPSPDRAELLLHPVHKAFFSVLKVLFSPDLERITSLDFIEENGDRIHIVFSGTVINNSLPAECAAALGPVPRHGR